MKMVCDVRGQILADAQPYKAPVIKTECCWHPDGPADRRNGMENPQTDSHIQSIGLFKANVQGNSVGTGTTEYPCV